MRDSKRRGGTRKATSAASTRLQSRTDEALALTEKACQDVFRFGDKHLPEPVRRDLNRLWQRVLGEQRRRRHG